MAPDTVLEQTLREAHDAGLGCVLLGTGVLLVVAGWIIPHAYASGAALEFGATLFLFAPLLWLQVRLEAHMTAAHKRLDSLEKQLRRHGSGDA
jgi:hypothetical protein